MLQRVDPNDGFRARRNAARRARRSRRVAALAAALVIAAGAALALRAADDAGRAAAADEPPPAPAPAAAPESAPAPKRVAQRPAVRAQAAAQAAAARREPPEVMRGVHVTMRLAATPGKLEEYLSLPGLNTLQVDVKDEGGLVAFEPAAVPLARELGAARQYYGPWRLAELVHARDVYLVARVVTFQDSVLATQRPELALQRADGSVWRNHGGKAWANPYDRRVWEYVVDVAAAAARAGFDEIMFDYVRFPSDGDTGTIVYPRQTAQAPAEVVAEFLRYAARRLRPLGVRVSAAVFGLSATLDVGVAQDPSEMARHLDAIYPMAYPSHYRPGEFGLSDPNAAPGPTIAATMLDFRRELEGVDVAIVPWLQDFSLGRYYGLQDVAAQIDAALGGGAEGFLLWNALGEYTEGAVAHGSAGR